jgi:hypothetical protein
MVLAQFHHLIGHPERRYFRLCSRQTQGSLADLPVGLLTGRSDRSSAPVELFPAPIAVRFGLPVCDNGEIAGQAGQHLEIRPRVGRS